MVLDLSLLPHCAPKFWKQDGRSKRIQDTWSGKVPKPSYREDCLSSTGSGKIASATENSSTTRTAITKLVQQNRSVEANLASTSAKPAPHPQSFLYKFQLRIYPQSGCELPNPTPPRPYKPFLYIVSRWSLVRPPTRLPNVNIH